MKDREISTEMFGIILLLVSLFADGFLPDFQAYIKSEFKPEPTEMMAQINKYVTLIAFTISVINF